MSLTPFALALCASMNIAPCNVNRAFVEGHFGGIYSCQTEDLFWNVIKGKVEPCPPFAWRDCEAFEDDDEGRVYLCRESRP